MNLLLALLPLFTAAFQPPATTSNHAMRSTAADVTSEKMDKSHLYVPSNRDAHYEGNVARYLLDLDEEGATFDFCGGELHMWRWFLLHSFVGLGGGVLGLGGAHDCLIPL
jgi:hypothetical protein